MSQQLILQQYYTRARQGIFRSNEGYDTIAKSDSLDNNFIKKTLHPFCGYDAPKELQKRGERDVSLYPESLVCFHSETGELILGRSVYVGADFTGQRNTFFTHNYVIPPSRRDEFLKVPAKIFAAGGFVSHHEAEGDKSLPELAAIPQNSLSQAGPNPRQVLSLEGIDEKLFKQLLYAVISSITSKKKVYVILDADVSESSLRARELLRVVYDALPYELRRHFGFMTYSSEPQSKKYINVMFVEKGSIRAGDQQIEKDFLFDFPNQRFANVDLQGASHEYLDFAWHTLERPHIRERFYDFVEEVLAGADSSITMRIATYYQLAAFYQIEQGIVELYKRNKAGILHTLAEYAGHDSISQKQRLHELFMNLFREENRELTATNFPTPDMLKAIVAYYPHVQSEAVQEQFAAYFINVLKLAKETGRRTEAAEIYKLLQACEPLFSLVAGASLQNPNAVGPVFEEYAAERLGACRTISEVQKEIRYWSALVEQSLQNRVFQERAQARMLELFDGERDQLGALLGLHAFFADFTRQRAWAEEIIASAERKLLAGIKLESLGRDAFEKIVAILREKPQVFLQELDPQSRREAKMILAAGELLENAQVFDPEQFYQEMSREDAGTTQRMLQSLLDGPFGKDQFLTVTFAFYNPDSPQAAPYRFHDMLRYIKRKGGADNAFDFIVWSLSRHIFFTKRTLLASYKEGLKQYLTQDVPDELRDKQARKKWYGIKHPELRKVLEEVADETSGGLSRFFRKYMDKLLIGVAGVISIGVIAWVVMLSLGDPSPAKMPQPPVVNDHLGNKENPGTQPSTGQQPDSGTAPTGTTPNGTVPGNESVPASTTPAGPNDPAKTGQTPPAATGSGKPEPSGKTGQQGAGQAPKAGSGSATTGTQTKTPATGNNPATAKP
ncbi:GAP1-N2 domain-containing protein [Brevibacillus fluminis]|uniref:GAP1-N2 domain-containing protein n=1 Tax=Brevibacillus fluminis TaxID=511487 RepID=UPI003F8A2267